MEKYAKLLKGLEMCAGPECCKDGCPYYGETRGGKTCRAWLLNDAAAAIENEEAGSETLQELLQNAEAERDKLHADVDLLEEANNAYRAERDVARSELAKLKQECTLIIKHRDDLAADNNILHERCKVQQNEINALLLKTNRASVCSGEQSADYWRGRAEALEKFVIRLFEEASADE